MTTHNTNEQLAKLINEEVEGLHARADELEAKSRALIIEVVRARARAHRLEASMCSLDARRKVRPRRSANYEGRRKNERVLEHPTVVDVVVDYAIERASKGDSIADIAEDVGVTYGTCAQYVCRGRAR